MTKNTSASWWERLKRRLRQEDGYAGTAIAFPAVIVLVFVLFQFGFWYIGQNVAQAAAENAYQQGRSYQATDQDGVAAGNASLATNGKLLENTNVVVTRGTDTVTATVTGNAFIIIPFLQLPPITVALTGPIEKWVPAP